MVKSESVDLTSISEQVYFQFTKRRYDFIEKHRIGVHVTDLTNECMRNVVYGKIGKGEQSFDTNTMSHFFLGEAVHQALDKAAPTGQGEKFLLYDFGANKPITPEEYHKLSFDRKCDVLWGERDALYKVQHKGQEANVIVDYKTWKSNGYNKKSPSEEHVFQVNEYALMLNKIYGIEAKFGCIVYLDIEDKFAKPLQFPFELDSLQKTEGKILLNLAEIKEALLSGKLPKRVLHWKCYGYCPHAKRCATEEVIKVDQNEINL